MSDIKIVDWPKRPAEQRRDELERENAELQMVTKQRVSKIVIEQMLEALEMADELIDQLIIDNTDNYAEERAKIRAAIAAALAAGRTDE